MKWTGVARVQPMLLSSAEVAATASVPTVPSFATATTLVPVPRCNALRRPPLEYTLHRLYACEICA